MVDPSMGHSIEDTASNSHEGRIWYRESSSSETTLTPCVEQPIVHYETPNKELYTCSIDEAHIWLHNGYFTSTMLFLLMPKGADIKSGQWKVCSLKELIERNGRAAPFMMCDEKGMKSEMEELKGMNEELEELKGRKAGVLTSMQSLQSRSETAQAEILRMQRNMDSMNQTSEEGEVSLVRAEIDEDAECTVASCDEVAVEEMVEKSELIESSDELSIDSSDAVTIIEVNPNSTLESNDENAPSIQPTAEMNNNSFDRPDLNDAFTRVAERIAVHRIEADQNARFESPPPQMCPIPVPPHQMAPPQAFNRPMMIAPFATMVWPQQMNAHPVNMYPGYAGYPVVYAPIPQTNWPPSIAPCPQMTPSPFPPVNSPAIYGNFPRIASGGAAPPIGKIAAQPGFFSRIPNPFDEIRFPRGVFVKRFSIEEVLKIKNGLAHPINIHPLDILDFLPALESERDMVSPFVIKLRELYDNCNVDRFDSLVGPLLTKPTMKPYCAVCEQWGTLAPSRMLKHIASDSHIEKMKARNLRFSMSALAYWMFTLRIAQRDAPWFGVVITPSLLTLEMRSQYELTRGEKAIQKMRNNTENMMKSQFDPSRVETAMQEELNKTEIKTVDAPICELELKPAPERNLIEKERKQEENNEDEVVPLPGVDPFALLKSCEGANRKMRPKSIAPSFKSLKGHFLQWRRPRVLDNVTQSLFGTGKRCAFCDALPGNASDLIDHICSDTHVQAMNGIACADAFDFWWNAVVTNKNLYSKQPEVAETIDEKPLEKIMLPDNKPAAENITRMEMKSQSDLCRVEKYIHEELNTTGIKIVNVPKCELQLKPASERNRIAKERKQAEKNDDEIVPPSGVDPLLKSSKQTVDCPADDITRLEMKAQFAKRRVEKETQAKPKGDEIIAPPGVDPFALLKSCEGARRKMDVNCIHAKFKTLESRVQLRNKNLNKRTKQLFSKCVLCFAFLADGRSLIAHICSDRHIMAMNGAVCADTFDFWWNVVEKCRKN